MNPRDVEMWQEACTVADFSDEEMRECSVGEQQVLLVRVGEEFITCPALCPHLDEPLVFGMVDGSVLTCTKHAWQWDLKTGDAIGLALLLILALLGVGIVRAMTLIEKRLLHWQ